MEKMIILCSSAHEQNRCHAQDHHKWCAVRCDEVHNPSWNISSQDAWYTGSCSSDIPGFHPAPHSDNFQQSPWESHSVSVISSLFCLRCWAWLFVMKECVVRLSTLYTSNLMKTFTSVVCVCSVVLQICSWWISPEEGIQDSSCNNAFKICGITHYHSHQVLICDVKFWNFCVIVFRFYNFPFQLGFYSKTKTVNK